jgi:F-type H+-transporting ATPase subunit beta
MAIRERSQSWCIPTAAVGKTVIIMELKRKQHEQFGVQRSQSAFARAMGLSRCKVAVAFHGRNEPSGVRMRSRLMCLSIIDYGRGDRHQDALPFRVSAVKYSPTLSQEMASFHEWVFLTTHSSVASFQGTYVPANDLTDRAPANLFAHLSSTLVPDRKIASLAL